MFLTNEKLADNHLRILYNELKITNQPVVSNDPQDPISGSLILKSYCLMAYATCLRSEDVSVRILWVSKRNF